MSEALVKQEPQFETIKRSDKEVTVARKADGKFARKVETSVKQSTKKTIDFIHGKAEGKDTTRLEEMQEAIYEAVLSVKEEPKNLLAATKAIETLDALAHGKKTRDRILEKADPTNTQIKVIVISLPQLPHPEQKQETPAPAKPSWLGKEKEESIPVINAEIVEQN